MDSDNYRPANDFINVSNPTKPGEDLGNIQSTITPDTKLTLSEWFDYIGKLIKKETT